MLDSILEYPISGYKESLVEVSMLKSVLLIACILIAIFINPWAWIAVLLLVLWKARIWYRYNGRPWRKIHFNAMIFFAAALGREQANSEHHNIEFNVMNAYVDMIESFGQIGIVIDEDPAIFATSQLIRFGSPDDQSDLIDYLADVKKVEHVKAIKAVFDYFKKVNLADPHFQIRAIIAGIIENQYTILDRAEYLNEVMMGNAT